MLVKLRKINCLKPDFWIKKTLNRAKITETVCVFQKFNPQNNTFLVRDKKKYKRFGFINSSTVISNFSLEILLEQQMIHRNITISYVITDLSCQIHSTKLKPCHCM